MEFQLASNLVSSYKRLSYKAWYAIAEFVDNSTQAYLNNKSLLDDQFQKESTFLTVKIEYSATENSISIIDNSMGMNYNELVSALILGNVPLNNTGRSKYGLGMKTAACWFGNKWYIQTKKLGESESIKVDIDVDEIAKGNVNLPETRTPASLEEHYTRLVITDLNSKLRTNTISKIKEYLQSMYRIDFRTYGLHLYWQGDILIWDELKNHLYITENGEPYIKNLNFMIGNLNVTGWAGVLAKGKAGRKNAGFSVIQANRVIEGWPNGYKPTTIFGDQEGGSNDLVNQRITGELYLDGFAVSHTKDSILWQDNQQEEIEEKLYEECKEAIHAANIIRFNKDFLKNKKYENSFSNQAMSVLELELKNKNLSDYIETIIPPPEEIIKKSYSKIEDVTLSIKEPDLVATIGHSNQIIKINIYFSTNSEFEPYAVIELISEIDHLNVIINTLHPYYRNFSNEESTLDFVRQCIYDGVAEWKAIKLLGSIKPNTVKFIKDGLLRVPFEILNN